MKTSQARVDAEVLRERRTKIAHWVATIVGIILGLLGLWSLF